MTEGWGCKYRGFVLQNVLVFRGISEIKGSRVLTVFSGLRR